MLIKVISGGQTGADIGGLRAARLAGIATGGWAPKGWMTERGPMPFLLRDIYGLQEHTSPKYPPRTATNIKNADMTLIVAASGKLDGGSALTRDMCFKMKKPVFHISLTDFEDGWLAHMSEIHEWVMRRPHRIINVAGNRESRSPGIGAVTKANLYELFMSLK